MRHAITVCVVCVSIGTLASGVMAESVFRCADGTFTNKTERRCPAYVSKGIVRVQEGTVVRTNESKPSFAEVKMLDETVKHRAAGR